MLNSFLLQEPIAVLGAGSWGTALAILLANNGQPVRLWGHDAQHMADMAELRNNPRYLPGIAFPASLQLVTRLDTALQDVRDVLIVVPSTVFATVLTKLKPLLTPQARIAWATKGLSTDHRLLHQVASDLLGPTHSLAILSGPSFAREVALGLPTAITAAATDPAFAQDLVTRFSNHYFRVYLSNDLTGIEICGVVKNILAIAAGISDGLHLGANALSALITRGLTEMQRLGLALGGQPATFIGLAGLGDLVLSCTDNQSRNRRFGQAIAQGKNREQALLSIGQAVEGCVNLPIIYELAQQRGVEMPIIEQVYRVVYQGCSPQDAIHSLLQRQPRQE